MVCPSALQGTCLAVLSCWEASAEAYILIQRPEQSSAGEPPKGVDCPLGAHKQTLGSRKIQVQPTPLLASYVPWASSARGESLLPTGLELRNSVSLGGIRNTWEGYKKGKERPWRRWPSSAPTLNKMLLSCGFSRAEHMLQELESSLRTGKGTKGAVSHGQQCRWSFPGKCQCKQRRLTLVA